MYSILRKLLPGIFLIGMVSVVLLVSDGGKRKSRAEKNTSNKSIAVFQFSSREALDDTVKGIIGGLGKGGYENGKNIKVDFYNAENDMATANAISKNIIDMGYDIAMTASTLSLQAFANANKAGKCIQIFATVTDPYNAGVGIKGEKPEQHPPWLIGTGTFQPVEQAFRMAKAFYPPLKKVGTVWNPGEACSEACTIKARAICKELGIELIEANVENTSGIGEAAASLAQKDVEALYLGGDNTVSMGISQLVSVGKKNRIPLFTNDPLDAGKGAVFGLGANYFEVGVIAGDLACRVINGLKPETVPIKNMVPEKLAVNRDALSGLKYPWKVPSMALAMLKNSELNTAKKKPAEEKVHKIGIVYFAPDPATGAALKGLKDSLEKHGYIQGKNILITEKHAQGEIANITPILQSYMGSDIDVIVPLTTPCLSAACAKVKRKPVVFTSVYNPIAAGAGSSYDNHLPNVTGAGSMPPLKETVDLITDLFPSIKKVGTIYNSSEANSRNAVEKAKSFFSDIKIKLMEITVTNSNDVFEASRAVIEKDIQSLWITGDNTVLQAYDTVVKICEKEKLPLVINDVEFLYKGGLAACGISFYTAGYEGGNILSRVLSGEDPASIPMKNLNTKRIALNFASAKSLDYKFTENVLLGTELYLELNALYGRPARIAFVSVGRSPLLDTAHDGVIAGLESMGLIKKTDFNITEYCAEEEIAQLPLIMANIKNTEPDIVITLGTPVLIAAVQAIKDIPIVFTVASNPHTLKIYDYGRRPSNLTGVHDNPPLRQLIELAEKTENRPLKNIGIIWDPAQPNSQISERLLSDVCASLNMKLVSIPQIKFPICRMRRGLSARGGLT